LVISAVALPLHARILRPARQILAFFSASPNPKSPPFVAKCPNLAFSKAFHAFAHVFHAPSVACLAFLDEFYAW
jgi:hypothetical protein